MSDQAFSRIATSIQADTRYPVITWELRDKFRLADTYSFFVDISEDLETWTRLNTLTPVTDAYTYTDANIRRYIEIPAVWYRVVLLNGSTTYTSSVVQLPAPFTRITWPAALHVVAAEYYRIVTTGIGVSGYLYKRRKWGTQCTECINDMTGLPVGVGVCETCYGTGIVGGYLGGVSWYADFTSPSKLLTDTEQAEQADVRIRVARGVAFPLLEKDDLWVDLTTDDRYIVDKVQYDAELSGVPLICSAVLRAAPIGDAVYSVGSSE